MKFVIFIAGMVALFIMAWFSNNKEGSMPLIALCLSLGSISFIIVSNLWFYPKKLDKE